MGKSSFGCFFFFGFERVDISGLLELSCCPKEAFQPETQNIDLCPLFFPTVPSMR